MRTWIGIVAVGLFVVFAGIWGFGGLEALFPAQRTAVTRDTETTSPGDAGAEHPVERAAVEDPLVSPARVPGLPSPPIHSGPGSLLRRVAFRDAFVHDDRAIFEPHGHDVCFSGCAVSRHPTGQLTGPAFRQLLTRFARQPADETSPAFETLLYYGRQAKGFLDREGSSPLDPVRAAVLRRELSRTHARIAIRVVDQYGVVRTWLPPTRVPLDRRHVFEMETSDLQPLVTSGTVKRVGLYHLWNRL